MLWYGIGEIVEQAGCSPSTNDTISSGLALNWGWWPGIPGEAGTRVPLGNRLHKEMI